MNNPYTNPYVTQIIQRIMLGMVQQQPQASTTVESTIIIPITQDTALNVETTIIKRATRIICLALLKTGALAWERFAVLSACLNVAFNEYSFDFYLNPSQL